MPSCRRRASPHRCWWDSRSAGIFHRRTFRLTPGEVRGFVSIDSAPLKRKYMSDKEFWMLNHMAPVYSAMPWKMLRNAAAQGIGITEYAQQNMREMVAQYSRDEFCGLMKHGFIMLAGAIGADLGYDITCPCILLCGEHDKTGATKRYNPNGLRANICR